jgi:NAD(P)-dependent dehydrogenase (short-subunit alcohol dehydrogenase family)
LPPVPTTIPTSPVPDALRGRVVLITGASGGLGAPLARACAAQGATVVLHGRVVRKLEALYDEIVAAGHPEPVILPLDLAKAVADDFGNVASALQAQVGRLDALVHTAALLGSLGPIEHQSFDSWLSLLRVNVAAPMGLTRALMPMLDGAPDASVVFTLDNRGEQPRAYWGGYAVTKAGVATLARELADEWENRPHLRINAVIPGPIRSPLRGQTHPGEDKSVLPAPDALVPLYLHLLAGQTKADSGQLVDAQAWLAGAPCASALRA